VFKTIDKRQSSQVAHLKASLHHVNMKIDWEIIVILLRLVRKFGYFRVNIEVQKYLTQKEKKSGRNLSLEKEELARLLREL
jgi:hypothetical protein